MWHPCCGSGFLIEGSTRFPPSASSGERYLVAEKIIVSSLRKAAGDEKRENINLLSMLLESNRGQEQLEKINHEEMGSPPDRDSLHQKENSDSDEENNIRKLFDSLPHISLEDISDVSTASTDASEEPPLEQAEQTEGGLDLRFGPLPDSHPSTPP